MKNQTRKNLKFFSNFKELKYKYGCWSDQKEKKELETNNINFVTYQKYDALSCIIQREKYKLQNEILLSFGKFNSFSTDQEFENSLNRSYK